MSKLGYLKKFFENRERLLRVSEILYIELFTFIVVSFLALPLWESLIFALLHIPLLFKIKENKPFKLYGVSLIVSSCVVGMMVDSGIWRNLVVAILSFILIYSIEFGKSKKTAKGNIQAMFTLVFPYLVILIIDFMQNNIVNALNSLFVVSDDILYISCHTLYCYTLVFLWVLYAFFCAVIKRKNVAVLCTSIPMFVIGFINMAVLYLTSFPFVPSDILSAGTAFNSIEGQSIPSGLIKLGVVSLILVIAFIIVVCKVYGKSKAYVNQKPVRAILTGVSTGICVLMMFYLVGYMDLLNFRGNYRYGYIYYFMSEMHVGLEEPVGYINPNINTSLEEQNSEDEDGVKPNVIFIMSEAFSDLDSVYDLELSEDAIPYFHSLQEKYPNGVVYSSVLGNNTVSSELESLSGIATGLSEKGSNVYQRYLKGREAGSFYTVGNYFQSLGYCAEFFHPSYANNYARKSTYDIFGYDDSIFIEDMDADAEKFRAFITDEVNYNVVLDRIKNSDEPLFLMNVTMQNHAKYEDDIDEVGISENISILNSEGEYRDVELYLSLLKESDNFLKSFLSELEKLDEPTVVLFFGDHQPMVSDDFYSECLGEERSEASLEKSAQTYEIPYLIWSNYDVDSKYVVPEVTSMNYLSLIVNSYLGNKDTEWFELIRGVQEYYPVITENFIIDSNGNFMSIDDAKQKMINSDGNDEGLKLLKKYWYACYSMIAEK